MATSMDHGDHDHATAPATASSGRTTWSRSTAPPRRRNTRWKLVDRQTGDANHAINWKFRVGDWVKIELVNEMDSDHPMHHPFHVHGAGRFLVLDRDGVRGGQPRLEGHGAAHAPASAMNILLEVTNPGRWMAHCHIAEHHESGMMFSFDVAPAEEP